MRRLVGSLLTVALLGLGLLLASPAGAATFAVTNLNDSGGGSLRQALLDAQNSPGADTITVGVTGTINLTSGPLTYESADNLTISGNGVTVSAAGVADVNPSGRSPRVFELSGSTGTVTIGNMTITGGRAITVPQANPENCNQFIPGNGGGIYSTGTLVLTEVTVTGNEARRRNIAYNPCSLLPNTPPGPEITGPVGGQGGGVWASEFLTITNSTISNNIAQERAGGAYTSAQLTLTGSTVTGNRADDSGGGLYSEGTVTAVRSTISGNVTLNSGGGILSAANMSISESTIANNTAGRFAGGVTGTGTGQIRNSTIVGNESGTGGNPADGYGGGVAILGSGTFSIRYSTIVGNESLGAGANLYGQQGGVGSTVSWNIEGSVMSNPVGANDNCSIVNVTASYSYAFGNNPASCFPAGGVGTNAAGGAPFVSITLASNGGPTQTLMPGAPLQGQIPASACTVSVDQRNRVRPFDNACDIGAVEDQSGEDANQGNGGGTVGGVCSEYNPINPVRVLDTREASGVTQAFAANGAALGVGRIGQGGEVSVRVTNVPGNGDAGVPAIGVGAVVLNVTSTQATVPSFVTVWPTGADRPLASNLNSEPGTDVPNATIAKVGNEGRVSLFNNAGQVHLIVDVVGWYASCGKYTSLVPTRVLDTRTGVGAPAAIVSSGGQISVQVTGVPGANGTPGVPATGVSAVVLNVTSTESSAPSFVTVWPTGEDRPLASNVNTEPGQDVPNLVIAKVGNGGQVSLFNNAGNTHLVADVLGYFAFDSTFVPLNPTRALDTRTGLGATGPVGPQQSRNLRVLGVGGAVPVSGVAAVVINVTATEATAPSFVTVWPAGATRPNASSLNTEPGVDVPNLVIAKVGVDGSISLFNNAGNVHLVGDILGYFPIPTS